MRFYKEVGADSTSTVVLIFSLIAISHGQPASTYGSIGEVSKSNTLFASDLYTALRKTNPGNLVCSPLSVSAVMAMVKNGARGITAQQIKDGLHFPDDDTLNSGYRSLLHSLKLFVTILGKFEIKLSKDCECDSMIHAVSNENFTLEIANKVYTNQGFDLSQSYNSTLSTYYGVQIEQLNFGASGPSADRINAWVEGVTHNKIKDLVQAGDLDALTRLVLINGIYFKGKWEKQFDATKTIPAKFYMGGSKEVDVDMMHIEDEFPYAEILSLDAKVISLPYQGDRLSMIIILPNNREGLTDLEDKLKKFDLSKLPAMLRSRKVNLQMPKFKLESTITLNEPLQSLGLTSMFGPDADFSGIPSDPKGEPLYVSKAIQKAFIEVNEEGSEAAAATGVMITLKSAVNPSPKYFVMDHPFVAFIQHGEVDTQLFWTTVANPLASSNELRSEVLTEDDPKSDTTTQDRGNTGGQGSSPWTLLTLGLLYALQRAL